MQNVSNEENNSHLSLEILRISTTTKHLADKEQPRSKADDRNEKLITLVKYKFLTLSMYIFLTSPLFLTYR